MPQNLNSHYHPVFDPYFYAKQNYLTPIEMHIIKYVTRHRKKGGVRDLRAAILALLRNIHEEYGIEALEETVLTLKDNGLHILSQCNERQSIVKCVNEKGGEK